MAEKFYAYYRVTSATPYPVQTVVRDEETEALPDEMYIVEGWTKGSAVGNYNHAIFDTWEDQDGETTVGEWFVTPGTPPVATTTNVANLTLAQRQTIKLNEINSLITSDLWTQGTDSLLTLTSRNLFKTYLDTLRNIPTAQSATWGTTPENVTMPVRPTEAYTTTDIADRAAEFMADNTVNINKQRIFNRNTLLPEFGFDDASMAFFDTVGTGSTFTFDTTQGLSGGACLRITKANNALSGSLKGKQINYTSVREGSPYGWNWEYRTVGGVFPTSGLFRLIVLWYSQNYTPLATPSTTLHSVNYDEASSVWKSKSGQVIAPTGARFATLQIFMSDNYTVNSAILVDGVQFRPSVETEHLGDNSVTGGKLAGVRSFIDAFNRDWGLEAGDGPHTYSTSTTHARTGTRALLTKRGNQVTPNVTNPSGTLVSPEKYMFSPYKTYKVSFRIKRISASGTTPGLLYAGIICLKADRKTKINVVNGTDTLANAWYISVNALDQSTIGNSDFVEYEGYFGGTLASGVTVGTQGESKDPRNPRLLPYETAFVQPVIAFNQGVTDGTGTEIAFDALEFTEMPTKSEVIFMAGQEDLDDDTTFRLMLTGAFGLGTGATFRGLPPGNDANNATRNGWYSTDASTLNLPAGATTGIIRVDSRALDRFHQTFFWMSGGNTPSQYHRQQGSAGFAAWKADTEATNDFGYAQGYSMGGTVTQATSKTTAVTLNKRTGTIVVNASALASGASALFQVNNSFCTSLSIPIIVGRAAGNYRVEALSPSAGSFFVRITNVTVGSLSESITLVFALIKGADT